MTHQLWLPSLNPRNNLDDVLITARDREADNMAEPNRLHIKRKITDDAPDFLILESDSQATSQVRYVKKQKSREAADGQQEAKFAQPLQSTIPIRDKQTDRKKRVFHLKPEVPRVTGKRKVGEEGIATFVEEQQLQKRSRQNGVANVDGEAQYGSSMEAVPQQDTVMSSPSTQYKRPGRGSAIRAAPTSHVGPETDAERRQVEALAEYMHEASLQEIQRELQPKPVPTPKLSGARSREIHKQRTAAHDYGMSRDVDMESEDDYVYETYILAPTTDLETTSVDMLNDLGNVGYLIIKEEDQSLWETYREDDQGDVDWHSDDEDENAEDYYGADYPEDEVASDDDFDRNPYNYRGNASGDEEWDEDTGTYSDDQYDRVMNPFKLSTPQRFTKASGNGYESD
jgi:hypothetical protein